MTILQDILGLIAKRKIKTPSDKDYIVSAAYTDTQEVLKPMPKMEASLLNIGALKKYIQDNTASNLQKVTEAGAITTLPITANSFIKQGGASSEILAANGSIITAGTNITISGGIISSSGGGGSSISLSAIGNAPNANAATITGSVLNLQPADGTYGGIVTIGNQTFAGTKTFTSQTILGDGVVGTPNYGLLPQATVGSTTGGVFDIRNTNTNIVTGNTIGTLQFSAKDDASVAYSTAQIKAITQNGIGTGSSGKTDLIFYTSNGSTPTERVKMNDLGLILNAETALTIASFDANKSIKSLTAVDGYPTLDQLKYVNGVTSSIQTQFSGKQATLSSTVNIKSINGNSILGSGNLTITATTATQNQYTILANNTASTAVPTEQGFRNEPSKAYAGATPTWTGTQAPSGTTNHTYSWNRIGNLVTLRVSLDYTVAGTSVSQVTFDLPIDCPTPEIPSGVSIASDVISYGSGMLAATKVVPSAPTASYSAIRIKSTGVYEVNVGRGTAAAHRYAYATIQYFTA